MPLSPTSKTILQRSFPLLLLAFLLIDTGYSFIQHLHMPLDGDLAAIVVPASWYQKVLEDPFGLSVLKGEHYGAPNRFFVHRTMSSYLLNMPLLLQKFAAPVDSIYLACAIFKTLLQLLIIVALAKGINTDKGFRPLDCLVAAALVTPFFQTDGYTLQMGIIEKSVTYSFFYPLPLWVLLVFFLPFFRAWHRGEKPNLSIAHHLLLACLALALPLSGPLVPAVVLLVCPAVLLAQCGGHFLQNQSLPFARRATKALAQLGSAQGRYFLVASIMSLWSLYVGSFNIENGGTDSLPLLDRYPALFRGCGHIFTQKLGLPLLTLGILVNLFLVSKFATVEVRQKLFQVGKWLAVFVVAYLLLLPLGGYRGYRSLIVRHDTIMPISLGLVFFYGLTTFALLRKITWQYRQMYAWSIVVFSALISSADLPDFQQNACEKAALETIWQSKEKVVKLSNNCPVMSWNPITRQADSDMNAELLKLWGVTDEVRPYYSE